jgi:hypothetical protein
MHASMRSPLLRRRTCVSVSAARCAKDAATENVCSCVAPVVRMVLNAQFQMSSTWEDVARVVDSAGRALPAGSALRRRCCRRQTARARLRGHQQPVSAEEPLRYSCACWR